MKLKELRKERGWTQPVLARKAGVSAGYIARLETCVKLAKALGVPVTALLE
jgi:transcriptional regulator with XRE-family HTH domain